MKIRMPWGEVVENKTPVWKTPNNHDTMFESNRTALFCAEPSLAKQEFKEDADINVILARVMKTGEIPNMVLPEHFTDVSEKKTYHEQATQLAEANALFYRLPADIRTKFSNDPATWADAVVQATEKGDGEALEAFGIDLSIEAKATIARAQEKAAKAAEATKEAAKKSEPAK